MSCKYYALPGALYESIMRRLKITDDPLITAQARLESEKDVLLNKHSMNNDEKLAKISDMSHTENIMREQQQGEKESMPSTCSVNAAVQTETGIHRDVHRTRKLQKPKFMPQMQTTATSTQENFYTPPQEKFTSRTKLKRIVNKSKNAAEPNLKPNILEKFYDFEPLVSNPEEMKKVISVKKKKSTVGMFRDIGAFSDSPRRIRSGKQLGI